MSKELKYLPQQGAITADPAQKFALKKQIEEVKISKNWAGDLRARIQ